MLNVLLLAGWQGRREGLLLEPRRRGAVQGGGADGGAVFARAAGRIVSDPGVRACQRNIASCWILCLPTSSCSFRPFVCRLNVVLSFFIWKGRPRRQTWWDLFSFSGNACGYCKDIGSACTRGVLEVWGCFRLSVRCLLLHAV